MDKNAIIKQYETVAYSHPVLKKQEEYDLIKGYKKNGDPAAKEKLINSYLRTVINLSKKFAHNNNLDILDLIQSGIVGIVTALDGFDLSQYKKITKNTGSLFAFWCYRHILCEIDAYYRNNIRQVAVTFTTNNRLFKINNMYKQGLFNKYETLYDDAVVKHISKELKLKDKEVKLLLTLFKPAVELDREPETSESEHDNHNSSYQDTILKDYSDNETPADIYERNEKYEDLISKIDNLDKEDRYIIQHRFGINCEVESLSDIGKKIGCSTGNVAARTKKIQDKLKNMITTQI